MGSSSRKYGCEYMYTDIQLSDWCVCPRVCPNTYYFTTHISYEKEKCSQALALALEFAFSFFTAHNSARSPARLFPLSTRGSL